MQSQAREDQRHLGILRRLVSALERPRRRTAEASVVAVTSGKGGTGKSFVATSLAIVLAQSGRRVTVVDCDLGLGNAHLLLGVNPPRTLQHLIVGEAAMADLPHATSWGPDLVAAGSGISGMAALSDRELLRLGDSLSWLAMRRDVLVLDTAAGISPQCLLTLMIADQVVVVTNPEIAALTDAYATIKCLSRRGSAPPVSVVVNRVPSAGSGRATFAKLAEVSRRFCGCAIHYLGEVPDDPAVTQRRLGQPPLVVSEPAGETARRLRRATETLDHNAGVLRPRTRTRSLPDRLRAGLTPLPV